MTLSLSDTIITGKIDTPPRILLYSLPKVGKSTFASGFKKHFIMNLDGSQDNIDCSRTAQIKSSQEAMDILYALCKEEHSYECLVVDTIDWLEQLLCKEIAEEADKKTIEEIKWGRGYPELIRKWQRFLAGFDTLRNKKNMTILLLCHSDVKKHVPPDGDEYNIYTPKLYGKVDKTNTSLALLTEYVDVILFANERVLVKKSDDGRSIPIQNSGRILYTDSSSAFCLAGNRYQLSPQLPFTAEAFLNDLHEKRYIPKEDANKKDK